MNKAEAALDSDQLHMGPALHLISRMYAVEDRARGLTGEERLELRKRLSVPLMEKLHQYLIETRDEVLPKSPAARAVRCALNQWEALTRFLEDGDLEIDKTMVSYCTSLVGLGCAGISSVDSLAKIGFQHVNVVGRSIKAAALVAMISARQEAFFAPTSDSTLRDAKAAPKLVGGPEALLLQPLPTTLELIGIA